ncbi:MAG: 1,4-dihydroxy-2-naphthoate octaprenyltransferase, partial [Opitutaceae bacterium]|jgi:1,4-dihydroxy-2-naphthoate octaprenyltransferase|nr:1,4-dihydroxy-2-naphthoate octaprenyltransferase [Opitutaceae bacterium]
VAVAAACLGFALLVQVGTNFANEYFDFMKGADAPGRVGPRRAVAAGLVSPRAMLGAASGVFAAALVVGLTLLGRGGWPLPVIGVASIVCGLAYTGGPYPLGYNGLGDVFVFVFFGLVAVGATFFVQTGRLDADVLVAGAGVGALAVNILVANNYRDVEMDRWAGKRTLVVRFGRGFARVQFGFAHMLAVAVVLALAWRGRLAPGPALVVAALALGAGVRQSRLLRAAASPAACIRLLGITGRYLAFYGFGVALAALWR